MRDRGYAAVRSRAGCSRDSLSGSRETAGPLKNEATTAMKTNPDMIRKAMRSPLVNAAISPGSPSTDTSAREGA